MCLDMHKFGGPGKKRKCQQSRLCVASTYKHAIQLTRADLDTCSYLQTGSMIRSCSLPMNVHSHNYFMDHSPLNKLLISILNSREKNTAKIEKGI